MIIIDKESYIGEGRLQKCYLHPNNENLCLKVVRVKNHPKLFRLDQEIKYYKKIQRKNVSSFIAKYHGDVETSEGLASVFDLVKDETTNKVSLTMYDYLIMDNSPFSEKLFLSELKILREEMIKNKVIVRDLTAKNICCKIINSKKIKLIVIDGVGHRDFLPSVDWFSYFAKKKVDKIFMNTKLYSLKDHLIWLTKHAAKSL